MTAPRRPAPAPVRRRIHGLVLESDVDLPAPAAPGGAIPFLRFRLDPGDGARRKGGPRRRTIARGPDGSPWMTLARDGGARVLHVPGVGRFALLRGGREIRGAPAAGSAPGLFERVLLDHVLPRALQGVGIPVLHGSAVEGPCGALVFLGDTGAGKSSFAALLAARGLPLLADDAVRLEVRGREVRAHPGPALLRVRGTLLPRLPAALRARAVAGPGSPAKWVLDARVPPLRFRGKAVPVARVFVLTPTRARGFTLFSRPLPGREAALALLDATLRADPWDLAAFVQDMGRMGEIAARVPVHRIGTPKSPFFPPIPVVTRLIQR